MKKRDFLLQFVALTLERKTAVPPVGTRNKFLQSQITVYAHWDVLGVLIRNYSVFCIYFCIYSCIITPKYPRVKYVNAQVNIRGDVVLTVIPATDICLTEVDETQDISQVEHCMLLPSAVHWMNHLAKLMFDCREERKIFCLNLRTSVLFSEIFFWS